MKSWRKKGGEKGKKKTRKNDDGGRRRKKEGKKKTSAPCCSAPWGRSRPPSVPLARAPLPVRALARGEAAEAAEAAPEEGEAKEALLSRSRQRGKKSNGRRRDFFLSLSFLLPLFSQTRRGCERLGATGRVHEHVEELEEHGETKQATTGRTKERSKCLVFRAADALLFSFFPSSPFLFPETVQRRFRIRESERRAESDLQGVGGARKR